MIYTVSFGLADAQNIISRISRIPGLEWQPEQQPGAFPPQRTDQRIVIAGCGPAGLFTALRLAEYGLTATIIERGQPVEQRALDVQRFWRNGILDPESNVQFGEGGAGTFSDGKLTCRSKTPGTLDTGTAGGFRGAVRNPLPLQTAHRNRPPAGRGKRYQKVPYGAWVRHPLR